MNNKSIYIVFAFFLMSKLYFAQQEPSYSQYMFNKLVLNPAYTGSKNYLSTVVSSRDQWIGIPEFPQTQTISVHTPFYKQKMGAGILLLNDRIGPLSNLLIGLSYAYHIKLLGGKLAMGLRYCNWRSSVDPLKISYKDAGDPNAIVLQQTQNKTTMDAGLYYYTSSFYTGLSIQRMGDDASQANMNVLIPHAYFILGKGFLLNNNVVLNPSVLFKVVEGAPVNTDINVNVLFKDKLWIGTTFRSGFGFSFLTQYSIKNRFNIGYSFDAGVRNYVNAFKYPIHEIMLGFDFDIFKTKALSPRYL